MARRRLEATNADRSLSEFRLASRQLFNQFFRIEDPWNNSDTAFRLEGRFSTVEEILFEQIVAEPRLPLTRYKEVQPSIRVELRRSDRAPIMLNREVNSGYWDYPISEVTREPVLLFVQFFDWDILAYRDNQYVMAEVRDWSSNPETAGKRALIEFQCVQFSTLVPSR